METAPQIINPIATNFKADTDSLKNRIPIMVTKAVPIPAKTAFTTPTSRLEVNKI